MIAGSTGPTPIRSRSIVIGWTVLAALATASIARTLLAPDARGQISTAIVADFSIPADVRGLQGASNLDVVDLKPDSSIVLSGWIYDERTRRPGDSMYLDLDGTTRTAGGYGESRPDVAAAFKNAAVTNVGFHVVLSHGTISPGLHALRIGIRVGDERFESVRRYALRVP